MSFDVLPVETELHYFTIAELRASAPELENATKYPDATLEAKRDEAEQDWEELANRAFVPRSATWHARGGDAYLMMPYRDIREVTSVTLNGVELDITGVTVDPIIGALKHPSEWPAGVLTVTYAHGLDAPPAAVKRLVLMLARIYTLPSVGDPRATAIVNSETGMGYRVLVAKDGKTGIPDIDEGAKRYGHHTPVVG